MRKLLLTLSIITLISMLEACTPKQQKDNTLTLKVELKDKGVSFYDLFERIDLVPLELTDS